MAKSVWACVALVLLLVSTAADAAPGIGDRLVRGYRKYDSLPLTSTEALAAGWKLVYGQVCTPALGIEYALEVGGVTVSHPMSLYFTPAGQVATIGMRVFGEPKAPKGFYKPVKAGVYDISVSFRNATAACSSIISPMPLGDRLVINQDTFVPQYIPINEKDSALTGNWTKGSCFDTMGIHYFYDAVSRNPNMTWNAAATLPIVPMYWNGRINAFFFASSAVQQSLTSPNMWDGIALPNILMCKNFCSPACTFHDTWFWSTLHIYLGDYESVKCGGGCEIGCCPAGGPATVPNPPGMSDRDVMQAIMGNQ